MVPRWFYAHDKNRNGPYSDQQLRGLADAGEILRTDTIWREGTEKGVLAEKVKNLFPPTEVAPCATDAVVPSTKIHPSSQPYVSTSVTGTPSQQAGSKRIRPEPEVNQTPLASAIKNLPRSIISGPASTSSDSAPRVVVENDVPGPLDGGAVLARRPMSQSKQVKKGRAVAGKGAIIVGQDGTHVKLLKKCTVCGHQDTTRTTLPIRNGINKVVFFCPRCRKRREVEFQGFSN